jgi:hypothetical protein
MAHAAKVNEAGIVEEVLVVPDAQEHRVHDYLANDLGLGGTWVQTSYNGNIYYNFAGIGFSWDPNYNGTGAFIPPQPYPSWKLSNVDATWKAPIAYPNDGLMYDWNEELENWEARVYE